MTRRALGGRDPVPFEGNPLILDRPFICGALSSGNTGFCRRKTTAQFAAFPLAIPLVTPMANGQTLGSEIVGVFHAPD